MPTICTPLAGTPTILPISEREHKKIEWVDFQCWNLKCCMWSGFVRKALNIFVKFVSCTVLAEVWLSSCAAFTNIFNSKIANKGKNRPTLMNNFSIWLLIRLLMCWTGYLKYIMWMRNGFRESANQELVKNFPFLIK